MVCIAAVALVAAEPCVAADSLQQPLDEYQVKAAFIFNFIKFVEWPAGSFHSPTEPFSICIAGLDPFGRSLEDTVASHEIAGRPLSVQHISSLNQAATCHVLFIGPDAHTPLPPAALTLPGILTIGDANVSASNGAIIRFRVEDGKIRFEIDAAAAERKGLRISSRLLSLALMPESRGKP
jgi:hypothetical protein